MSYQPYKSQLWKETKWKDFDEVLAGFPHLEQVMFEFSTKEAKDAFSRDSAVMLEHLTVRYAVFVTYWDDDLDDCAT